MKYNITDPLTKRRFTITADTPPTDLDDLIEIAEAFRETIRPPKEEILKTIAEVAATHKVDPSLLEGIIKNESNYDPFVISPKGAQGLGQLMPGTAQEVGVTDPWDYKQNIEGTAKYISSMLTQFGGDKSKAIMAYNWGPGNVASKGMLLAPSETKTYYKKVMDTIKEKEPFWKKAIRFYTGSYLPGAGMVAGGIVGAPAGVPGEVAGSGIGGGLASMAGQFLESKIFNEPMFPEETAEAGTSATISGMVSSFLPAGASTLLKGTGKLAGKAAQAVERNLPFSPTAFLTETAGKTKKAIGSVMDLVTQIPPGSWVMKAYRGKTAQALTTASQDLLKQMNLTPSIKSAELKTAAGEAYAEMGKQISDKVVVPASNVQQYLLKHEGEKILSALPPEITATIPSTGQARMDDLINFSARIWGGTKKYGRLTPQNEKLLSGLQKALEKDFSVIDQLHGTRVLPFFQEARGLFKSAAEARKTELVERLISNSTRTLKDAAGTEVLDPVKFSSNLDKALPKLQAAFKRQPEVIDRLMKFRDDTLIYKFDTSQFFNPTKKPLASGIAAALGGGGAMYALTDEERRGKLGYLVVPALLQMALARSFITPSGMMNKYFTDRAIIGPLKGEAVKQLMKIISFEAATTMMKSGEDMGRSRGE